MNPVTQASLVFFGMVACLGAGYFLGFDLGKKYVMTRKEAAKIMAKASWKNRDRVQVPLRPSFFRTVNK